MPNSSIKNRLCELRHKKGVNQDTAAEACGISRIALARYEGGTRTPRIEIASKLAAYYGVSVDYLLGREDQEPHEAVEVSSLDKELNAVFAQLPDDASKQDVIDYILFKLGRPRK